MLKTGDFVKVTNTDLLYCYNGIVLSVDESKSTAKILCPELDLRFTVGKAGPLSLHQSEDGHLLVKKVKVLDS